MAKNRAVATQFDMSDFLIGKASQGIDSLFDKLYARFENNNKSKIDNAILKPINSFLENFYKRDMLKAHQQTQDINQIKREIENKRKQTLDKHFNKLSQQDKDTLSNLKLQRQTLEVNLKNAKQGLSDTSNALNSLKYIDVNTLKGKDRDAHKKAILKANKELKKANKNYTNAQSDITLNETAQNAIKSKVLQSAQNELKYSGEIQALELLQKQIRQDNDLKNDFGLSNNTNNQKMPLQSLNDKNSLSAMWEQLDNTKDADDDFVEAKDKQRESQRKEAISTQRYTEAKEYRDFATIELEKQTKLLEKLVDSQSELLAFNASLQGENSLIDNVLSVGSDIATKGSGLLSKGAGLVSKVAMPLMIAKAGYDAFNAGSDDDAILAQSGKQDVSEISVWDRIKHGTAGAIEGVSFGLLDKNAILNAGESVANFVSGDGFKTNKEILLESSNAIDSTQLTPHQQLLTLQAQAQGKPKPQFENQSIELADLSDGEMGFASINTPTIINNTNNTITQAMPKYRINDSSTMLLSIQGM